MYGSSNLDAVSRNQIWEEHCKKEHRSSRLSTHFAIGDPHRMAILPEKPNNMVPMASPDAATVQAATKTLHELCSIRDAEKPPEEKYVLPVTGNQEYGFNHDLLADRNPMFNHPVRGCDVTEYADAYVTMAKTSPFARKDPS